MNTIVITQEDGLEKIKDHSAKLGEPSWVLDQRFSAARALPSYDEPIFRYGIDIFMPVDEFDFSTIVPTNSLQERFCIEGEGYTLLDFGSAFERYPGLMREHLSFPLEDKFLALHGALWNKGTLLYLKRGANVLLPIHYDSLVEHTNQFDTLLIVAEKGASAVVVNNVVGGSPNPVFRSGVVRIVAKEGAQLTFVGLQQLPSSTVNFSNHSCQIGKDASVVFVDALIGSHYSKSDTSHHLLGEGAKTRHIGIFLGDGKQRFNISSAAFHHRPFTTSEIYGKGALYGKAKSLYRGLVRIEKNAENSNGYQKEETLLLGDNTEASAIPNLEIHNNNVRCSHSASTTHIDQEKLFYLASRGIAEKDALSLLVNGFFTSIIPKIGVEEISSKLQQIMEEKIAYAT